MSSLPADLTSAPPATSSSDDTRSWIRWAGLAFVLLFVVGWNLVSFTWEDSANDQEVVDWYASGGNRVRQLVGAYITTMAALAFLVFGTGLSRLIPRPSVAQLVRSLTQLFTALLVAGTAAIVSAAASVEIPGFPEPTDPELLRTVESIGFGMVLLGGLMAAGGAVLVSSYGLRSAGVIPSWLVVAGYVAGAVLIVAGVLFIPALLLVLWALAVAVTARPPSGTA